MNTAMIVVFSGLSGMFIGIGLIVGIAFISVKSKQKKAEEEAKKRAYKIK